MKIEILIPVILALLILSFMFKMIDKAYTEVNKSKLKQLAAANRKNAKKVLDIAENINQHQSMFLVGSTISNITIAVLLADTLNNELDNVGIFISLIISLVLVILFGVITPNMIGIKRSEEATLKTLWFVQLFNVVLFPIIFIVKGYQVILQKVFKLKETSTFTEDELLDIVEEAESEGSINENESNLIRSVFDFDELKVEDIFTPRVHVVAVSKSSTNNEITKAFKKSGYSRLPVYENNIDHIVGIINHKDFYNEVVLGKAKLEDIIKPSVVVTEYMKVSDLLALLKSNKAHMAIVNDEYGGTLGVVTMEDILEELVGDIWDEHDEIVEQMTKISDKVYKVKGNAKIEDLFEELELEYEVDHTTLNGFLLELFGYIPKKGEAIIYENLEFKILVADHKQVIEAEVTVIEQ
jgi:CBS domain containing-hemolysin-like protein